MVDREPRLRQVQKNGVRLLAHPKPFPTNIPIARHDERLRQPVHLELVPSLLARTSLNSKVRTLPRGITHLAMAVVMAPLPVPASITIFPSHNDSWKQMTAWSLVWTICVR